MSESEPESPAEYLFAQGKMYDWKQDKSPAAASLARANFQQAAAMGHTGAARALAHLLYEGRGGPQDREQALLLLWSMFKRGDSESLEELADLLASYAKSLGEPSEARRASKMAEHLEQLNLSLAQATDFMRGLAHKRRSSASKGEP